MQEDWKPLLPLAGSMLAAAVLVAAAAYRVWRQQYRVPVAHANARTARGFAVGFAVVAALWLVYGGMLGYGRYLQPDWQRQLLLYAEALWSIPLFMGAVAWAAGIGVGWVMHMLAREAQQGGRAG